MAKLVLSSSGSVLYQCFVDKERVTVGREPGNQIVIDDAAVSREHAVIVPVGNDHILEDLGSTSGTVVNGARVPRRILQHGDVMEFGAYHLRYLNPRAAADVDLERTMLIPTLAARPASAKVDGEPIQETRVPSSRAARVHFPKARVRWIEGTREGHTVALDRVVATFGAPGRHLAVITRRPQGFFIAHVEGRRTARVNGTAIGREPQLLKDRDLIEVAGEKLEFRTP